MRTVKNYTVMSAKTDTGIGSIIDVRDYRNIVVSIGTASSANMTIKCKGSIGEVNGAPSFVEASKSPTNQWEYIQMVDLNDGTAYSGNTGCVFSGTDGVRMFAVNVDNLSYLTFDITAVSAGSATIKLGCADNV